MKPQPDLGTLFDLLAERGSRTVVHLDRPFDIAPDGGTSYDVPALASLVREAAGWLAAAGARAGDRVAVLKDNHWDYAILCCAAARLGAVPAPISGHLPAETVQVLLKRLEPAVLVTTGHALALAAEAGADLGPLVGRTLSLDRPVPGALGLDDVRGTRPPPVHRRHDDLPLVINHTSGTTGVPKLVVHSTTTIIRRLAGFEAHHWPVLASRADDVVATASSYVHGRAIAWTASVFWLAPARAVVVTDPDPAAAEPFLRTHLPTTLEALPSTYVRWQPLTADPLNPFRRVRFYISTYDAMHPSTVRAFLQASSRRRPLWMQGWGQTETGPLTFRFFTRRSVAAQAERHPTTRDLGRPVPTRTRLRVVDPRTLQPVPAGEPGLVLADTRARCLGYVGEPQRFVEKVQGGWFNTGDLGVRTRTGRLRLLDREVDAVPGLSCLELEDVIDDRLPEVAECIILGRSGRLPLPVVVTVDGQLDAEAWRRAVHDLPELAAPAVLSWDRLPRTGTGKVRRNELRELFEGAAGTVGTGRWT